MNESAWIASMILGVMAFVLLMSTVLRAPRQARAGSFARAMGLALPDSLRAEIVRRVALRHRGGAIGLFVGVASSVFILSINPASGESYAAPFVLIGGAFSGLAVGVALTAATAAAPLDPSAVKYARPSAVGLADYVAPLERVGARAVIALSVIGFAATLAAGLAFGTILGVLIALGVGSLVFFEVAGRRLVERSQPAASPSELTWDDAVRASVLRDMVTAPITLGAYALVVTGTLLVDGLLAGSPVAAAAIVGAAVVAAVVMCVVAIASRPQRYFLRRLWPAVAA